MKSKEGLTSKNAHEIEYTEGNQTARSIDNRIWAIYGIYFGLLATAVGVVFHCDQGLHGLARWLVSGILMFASIAKMALVGHLQSYSDRVYDRLRELEGELDMNFHKLFEPPPQASKRLWGIHKWLSKYRARTVMQIWAIGVIVVALYYGLQDLNGGLGMIVAALAQAIQPVLVSVAAILVSVAAIFVSLYMHRENKRKDLIPSLVFSRRETSAWQIENVGRGPAMNIVIGDDAGNGKDFKPVIVCYPIAVGGRVSLKDHLHRAQKLVTNYTDVWKTPYSTTCDKNMNHESSERDRKLLEEAFENAQKDGTLINEWQLSRE